jgi:predicted nucleotidyltransferase
MLRAMDADPRPYPPWWTARARERRVLLDVAVERLRRAIRADGEIVGALIFGSYAAGRVGPQSDLDLIVVTTRAANGDPGKRHADIAKRLALGVPCDLIVYEPHEFERLSRERAFVAQARQRGIWIDATTSA